MDELKRFAIIIGCFVGWAWFVIYVLSHIGNQ
jgi:hypothetical protein